MLEKLALPSFAVTLFLGCSDPSSAEPTSDVAACQPTTIDALVTQAGNCTYWIEVTERPGCGKVLSIATTMGIAHYRFDSSGSLVELTVATDTGSKLECRNAGTTACTPSGAPTCSFACYTQESSYMSHACPTPSSDAGSGG